MWILESDADFLQGKRMWLKPGKKYLFGRVKRDGVRFAIDHKTISRKHFVISVDQVTPGDVSRIHARSRVTITDEKSKQGTFVDGQLLKDDTRELTGPRHSIRPGAFHHELIIKWEPCVLTFGFTKKELKAEALKSKRERLEELDIKVISEYATSVTTHVVAGKRNTAKGLQALVQGNYLVADSFVDSLVYAATPTELGEEENLSPLEEDFDSTWPKELNHLPPAGKEPTARPDDSYAPNPARANVFENFIFVFGDQKQHDNLLPPITLALGKALMYKVVDGETTAGEVVEFMRNTAGLKGFGDAQKDTDSGGVVMVRWLGTKQFGDWAQTLINEVALKLDQRAIDQAEFLDAILAINAFSLRQTIPFASTVEGYAAPPPTAASFQTVRQSSKSPMKLGKRLRNGENVDSSSSLQVASSQALPRTPPPSFAVPAVDTSRIPLSQPERAAADEESPPGHSNRDNDVEQAPPPAKRSRLRGAPIPKLASFDDGFDPDSVPTYYEDDYPESFAHSESQSQARSQLHEPLPAASVTRSIAVQDEPTSSKRKRLRSPSPSADIVPDSMVDLDDILPATTAMKKRKLALEAEAMPRGAAVPSGSETQPAPPPPSSIKREPKRKEREIDVREIARAQREQEEETARKEREDLEQGLGYGNDSKQPARLAVIVTMELPVRTSPMAQDSEQHSERWDPKWNGRKNFKNFRKSRVGDRAGGGGVERSRLHQLIVPLVEVKKNTYGIGDKYWKHSGGQDEDDDAVRIKSSGRRGERVSQVRTTQSQSQSQARKEASRKEHDTRIQSGTQTQTIFGDNTEGPSHEQAGDDDDGPFSTSPSTTRLQREAVAIVDHAINLDTPRRTRLDDRIRSQTQTQTQTQTPTPTPTQNTKKRSAPAAKSGTAAAKKKQKVIPTVAVHGSNSEDSDDLKFRFGRSRKSKA